MAALEAPSIDFVVAYRADDYGSWQFQQCVNDQDVNDIIRMLPTSYQFEVYQRVEK